MSYSIHQHLLYSAWANSRVAETLDPIDDTLLQMEVKSSFLSITKTLLHMWDAEVVWLHRLQGESLTRWPSEGYGGSKKDLLEGFLQSGKNVIAFVESRDSAFLNSTISYKNLKGEPFQDTVEDVLFHVVNHGSYHRGQITTMLRHLGVTQLLSTDLIHYLRAVRNNTERGEVK